MKRLLIATVALAAPTTAGAFCWGAHQGGGSEASYNLCVQQEELERRIEQANNEQRQRLEKADREQRERLEELEQKQRQSEQPIYFSRSFGKEREEEQE